MRVNSNAAAIETPEKIDNVEHFEASAVATNDLFKRSSPSKGLVCLLDSVCRLHKFYHNPDLVPLDDMKLTLKIRNRVRELFASYDGDLSDWILELETTCIKADKFFSTFMRDYIHYEFQVEKECSFAVVILLNFVKKFSLEPEAAFAELFGLSLTETVCAECYLKNRDIAQKDIRSSNLNYLKRAIALYLSDVLEDSDDDPNFELKQKSEDKDDSESASDNDSRFGQEDSAVKDILTNPFIDSDNNSSDPYEFKDSELGINPFELSDEETAECGSYRNTKLLGPRTSSVKSRQEIQCDHCLKKFQNRYNLKLHCIQIHRIFPDNMKVFKCPESQCDFVTGSKVCYNRHATTHLRKTSKTRNETFKKIVCSQCGISLVNKSSLSRHIKRRHHKF